MSDSWVIVGAGSAGCVVASRLSEDPDRSVVLLEAGPADDPASSAALGGRDFFAAVDLPGRTFPSVAAARTPGGPSLPYVRGRGLGGSSAVNAMVALRGDPEIYASWGWDDVDEAWARVMIPTALPSAVEFGPLDRALLAAASDAAAVPLTRRDGRRVSAADAYLVPALGRDNIEVRTDASVARVVIDGLRACGVELVGGEVIEADHVVLAAGAIHSPALLLRSGIDTPGIGDNLQDHPSVAFTLRLDEPDLGSSGALATGSILQRDGLQVLPLNHLGSAADVAGYGALMAAVMRPVGAAGTVRLASDDPTVDPLVEFNLLSDPEDLDQMVSGTNLVLDLLRREPFREVAREVYVDDHGTSWTALSDPERLVAWVRSAAGGYVHATGTCAMGTVVDRDGVVLGYPGLRVCDASVFPSIPDANTHLPTTMLAERLVARWRSSDAPSTARG